jgi:hypothetical protein
MLEAMNRYGRLGALPEAIEMAVHPADLGLHVRVNSRTVG